MIWKITTLILAVAVLFLIVEPYMQTTIEQDIHDEEAHAHEELLDASSWNPSVEIEILEDPKSGWNVHIITENFEFNPEGASKEHVDGEGHAHVYLDGVKLNRVYSEWYHIAKIEPGTHEIRVTLNANSHEDLEVNGEQVEAIETITVE